ncbi:MAG: hypothetical protein ACRDV7_08895 [Acidimicrobiia bacterium]
MERHRPGNAARAVGLIVLLGFLGFCGAIFATRWFPTDARPFAFGFLWLASSALVVPVRVAVGLATFERIPDRDPTEVHPLR